MPKVTVVNPHDWMGEDGSFPEHPRVRSRMIRVAQFIEYGGPLRTGETRPTLVPCRWRPGGRACPGFMAVLKQKDGAILALCMSCTEDEFVIYEWEDMPWARGPERPLHVEALKQSRAAATRARPPARPSTASVLDRALSALGCSMSADEVRDLISRSDHPTAVVQTVLGSLRRPPTKDALELFLPVLMNEWNSTPRPDLDGLSPTEARAAAPTAPIDLGRNRPCPCGSGKKFKRCCMSKGGPN